MFFISITLLSTQAHGQSGSPTGVDGDAETIVVTAQKRKQTLLNVAAPIAVLGGDRLRDRTVTDFQELVEQIPGVSVTSDYGGPSSKTISIRGVGGSDDYRPNGSPSVALHIDNIYQSSNLFLAMPFFDVERVEVLKGPQGTLYGRNSTAGVVNLITRNGGETVNGYLTGQYESFDRLRLEGAFGAPIGEGVGLRIAGTVDQGGAFQRGKGAGRLAGFRPAAGVPPIVDPGVRDWGGRDLFAGRITLHIDYAADSSLTLKAFGSTDRGESQVPDSRGAVSNGGFTEPDDDPYTFYSDRYPRRAIDMAGASGTLSHRLNDALRLDVAAGWQRGNRAVEGEGTGTPLRVLDFNFRDRVRQHSLEARLSNADGGFLDWVLGGFYLKDRVTFRTDLLAFDAYRSNLVSDYRQARQSAAGFAQADLHLTQRLTLTGGLRYTADEARFRGSTYDANPLGLSIVRAALPNLPVVFDNDYDDNNLSGRATLSYRPTDTTNIWASVGTGYKAGGFDGSTIFSVAEALPFKSEDVIAYEAGLKFAGRGGLFLNVDGFYYKFDNLQANTTTIVAGQATTANVRTNVAEARMYGVDAAAGATLVRSGPHRLTVDAGATLLSTKILSFDSSNPDIVAVNLGNDLPAAPHLSGNAQVAYTYAGDGWSLTATGYARRKTSEYKRLNNALSVRVPAYTLFNARLDLKLADSGLTVFSYVRNLTNAVYYLDRSATNRLVGEPRMFGGGARLDF